MRFILLLALPLSAFAEPAAQPLAELTLREALARTLSQHPAIGLAQSDIAIAEAEALQSGLRQNPELSLSLEDLRLGDGHGQSGRSRTVGLDAQGLPIFQLQRANVEDSSSGLDGSEITLALTQLVELGGKRVKRLEAANKATDVARWDFEIVRANALSDTALAFFRILGAQEVVRYHEQALTLMEEFHRTIEESVKAGKSAPLELNRIAGDVAMERVALQRAQADLDEQRLALASLWGMAHADFGMVVGEFQQAPALAAVDAWQAKLTNNPALKRWATELQHRDALVISERANATPDLTLTVGLRGAVTTDERERAWGFGSDGLTWESSRLNADDDLNTSLVFEASIPIPLFNRNQGTIRAMEIRREQSGVQEVATVNAMRNEVSRWHANATSASKTLAIIDGGPIAEAQEVVTLTTEGYVQGKFDYLDVLDARRNLLLLQTERIDTLTRYHEATIALQRLTGEFLDAATTSAR